MTSEKINHVCIERLRAANLTGRVAVVGSGLSIPHIASISKLEKKLSNRCRLAQRSPEQFFWNYAEDAHEKNRDEYYKVIRETYGDTLRWTADAYEHLVHVRFMGLATLNYDPQLPKALLRYDRNAVFSVALDQNFDRIFDEG